MNHGHHYIGLRHRHTLEREEVVIPCRVANGAVGLGEALERLFPEWIHLCGDLTWRAEFGHRALPSDSQRDYQSGVPAHVAELATGRVNGSTR